MDTMFINSGNSKATDPHRLLLNLSDKTNLKWSDKHIALSNLSIYYTWKNKKSHTKTINLKFQLRHGMKSFNYLMYHILYQIFKINLNIYLKKKHEKSTDNSSIKIYVSKIENRVTLRIKTGFYLELLTPETMKLLWSTTSKLTKDKNGENLPNLEITEVVLVHCNFVNNDYQHNSRALYTFISNRSFGQWSDISLKLLNQNFHILKYGLLIKVLNC